MTARRATPEQAAALVAYEVWMMFETCERLMLLNQESSDRRGYEWQVENNAFVESFLVHYRNVMDFLAPSPPRSSRELKRRKADDVTCGPFVGEAFEFILPGAPVQYRKSINTFLAHVSKRRGDGSMNWPILEMRWDMEAAFMAFLDRLSADEREWFLIPDIGEQDVPPLDLFSSGWSDETPGVTRSRRSTRCFHHRPGSSLTGAPSR